MFSRLAILAVVLFVSSSQACESAQSLIEEAEVGVNHAV